MVSRAAEQVTRHSEAENGSPRINQFSTEQNRPTAHNNHVFTGPSGLDGPKRGKDSRIKSRKKNERMGESILFFLRAPTHFVERQSGTAQLPLPSLPRGHASKRSLCFHAHGTISKLFQWRIPQAGGSGGGRWPVG